MSNVDYLREELRKLWKVHKEIKDKIESLECQLAIELENAENEKQEWKASNEDRKGW